MLRRIGRYRLVFSYLMALTAIVFAHKPLLLWGLIPVVAGMALRLWAAGYIIKKDQLCRRGPYALTRNPLYLGSFISGIGIFLLAHNWPLMLVYAAGFAVTYGCTILSEESYLEHRYGAYFEDYKSMVPRFLPRLVPHSNETEGSGFSWANAGRNHEYKSIACSLLVVGMILLSTWIR